MYDAQGLIKLGHCWMNGYMIAEPEGHVAVIHVQLGVEDVKSE